MPSVISGEIKTLKQRTSDLNERSNVVLQPRSAYQSAQTEEEKEKLRKRLLKSQEDLGNICFRPQNSILRSLTFELQRQGEGTDEGASIKAALAEYETAVTGAGTVFNGQV